MGNAVRGEDLTRDHPAFAEERRVEILRRMQEPLFRRSLLIQGALFAAVLLLWGIPLLNPIKLLVVLMHELSHVGAAYLTGGVVFGVAIDPGGAGVTLGMGGAESFIALAGYTGSLLAGCLLYYLSVRWQPGEAWAAFLVFVILTTTFGWIDSFTATFAGITVFFLILSAFVFKPFWKRLLLQLTAATSCVYPIIDVVIEYARTSPGGFMVNGSLAPTDLSQLSAEIGIPQGVLATSWIVFSLITVSSLLLWIARRGAEYEVQHSLLRRRKERERGRYSYDPRDPKTMRYTVR